MTGGDGNDYLAGGEGADTLTGGAGSDEFRWFGGQGADVITDLNINEGDKISVSGTFKSIAINEYSWGTTLTHGSDVLSVQGASGIQVYSSIIDTQGVALNAENFDLPALGDSFL